MRWQPRGRQTVQELHWEVGAVSRLRVGDGVQAQGKVLAGRVQLVQDQAVELQGHIIAGGENGSGAKPGIMLGRVGGGQGESNALTYVREDPVNEIFHRGVCGHAEMLWQRDGMPMQVTHPREQT